MTDMLSNREAVFDQVPADLEVEVPPGIGALDYYVQFASPLYEGYTWNNNMPNSLEAFIQGRTAMFFGYAYHRPEIKARNPQLNFSIARYRRWVNSKKLIMPIIGFRWYLSKLRLKIMPGTLYSLLLMRKILCLIYKK